jgi:two-component system, NtrC family, response regulator
MPTGNILIVEDQSKLRSLLKRIIALEGYTVFEASNLQSATRITGKETIDVILSDVELPDGNGIAFIEKIKGGSLFVEVIFLTAYGNIADGVLAMKNGAYDYISKGDDNYKLVPLIDSAMQKVHLHKKVQQMERQVKKHFSFDNIIGVSAIIKETTGLAKKIARTNTTVLLLGETGTGKELFARAIHGESARAGKSFIAVNCSTFSAALLESELFGYKAGAFTGAVKDKKGLISEAGGGTLFMDEIGEIPIELQARLLRVMETNEFIKVGDTVTTHADIRIIAATNKDLALEVSKGSFRSDLFYRLNIFTIHIPPLRDRKKDIGLLVNYFLHVCAGKINKPMDGISKDFIHLLEEQPWKGNIRELKNCIERAVITTSNKELNVEDLPAELKTAHPVRYKTLSAFDLASAEKLHVLRVLNYTKGNKVAAARLLNIGLTTLYRKIETYNIGGLDV